MSQSETIVNNIIYNRNQYFEFFMSKNLHNVMCHILIDGWQLMMWAWDHGCNYNGVE